MWRRNPFQENPDSDQSISDEEEDFDDDVRENWVSLGDRLENEKEEGFQLQSRLETLKEKCDNNHSCSKEHSSFCLEEDVEVPDSPVEGDCFSSGKLHRRVSSEELVSDSEENVMHSKSTIMSGAKNSDHSHGIEDGDGGNAWSTINKEAEALIHLDKDSSHFTYSKVDKSCKGAKSKMKPRFSFGFQPHKGFSWPAISNNRYDMSTKAGEVHERLKASDHGTLQHSIAEVLEDFNENEENQLEIVPADVEALRHGFVEHSMADLLNDLQDNSSLLRGNFRTHRRARGVRVQDALKRSIYSRGDRTTENEDLYEPFSNGSSSNDEADCQNRQLAIPEIKKQTISDKFQEALGSTSLNAEGTFISRTGVFSTGLFGKLQQVMQQEKETDTHFLNKLHSGASFKNEPSCITVKVVSRYLDAKLTVCYCTFVKIIEDILQPENPKILQNEGQNVTVIFNRRICADVDLDIGNLICIHPPWKEVDVAGDGEKFILSTYFSDITM